MTSRIKILHVTFDLTIGGAQQVIRQLIENANSERFESEVVCIDNRLGDIGNILSQQSVKIHLLNRRAGLDFNIIRALRNIIIKNKIDILHCHQYTPYLYGLLASFGTRSKVVFTEHGRFYPDYGTWKRKLVNPIFALLTAKIVAISKATRLALVQHENIPIRKIDVIYNGVKDKSVEKVDRQLLRSQLGILPHAFLFGTISRLQPIKNQSMMIRAFSKIHEQEPESHLVIVGDGESRSELENLVKQLDLVKSVTFTGFQDNPYRFHAVIDLFLLPSFSEGTSMSLLEAGSFSVPSVVTNVGGNPEIILDGETGLVVPSNDLSAFCNAALKLMKDHALYKCLSQNAKRRYLSCFTVEGMVNRYQEVYRKLCPK